MTTGEIRKRPADRRSRIRDCVRCQRSLQPAANWEGPICRSCHTRAVRTWGRCPDCATQRLLPGRGADGTSICRDCAGITRDFACARCGVEGYLLKGRLCARCTLADKLTLLLDDGTGRVRPELVPLMEGVLATSRPTSTLTWFANPQVPALLTGLARGTVPITHEAMGQLPNWRTAAFMHELLMHHGVLSTIDKQLMLFERWLTARLATIPNPDHAQVVSRFATWNELRRLRARSAQQTLRPTTMNESRQRINRAVDFLAWLTERDTSLRTCTQSDVDAWYTVKYATRRPTHTFLSWAMTAGLMPTIQLPRRRTSNPAPMAQHHRLTMIRKLLESPDIPLRERVVGLLVLFYAQPVSRIALLTTNDVVIEDSNVLLRIGDPPTPAPEPLASLLRELLAQRVSFQGPNANTAWLFPGRRAGQPMRSQALGALLRQHGIAVQAGRTSALRQLVLQAPAPVIASMLGYHDTHTAWLLAEAGGTWSRYAPGDDHKR
jgi:hypothetical protein